MSNFVRLDPPIPLITSRGTGFAHFIVDYGIDYNLMWVVFLDDSGECWSFDNPDIRLVTNLTFGRDTATPIRQSPITLKPKKSTTESPKEPKE